MKSMFEICPKIERPCGFCGKSTWNPMADKKGSKNFLFCGMVSGYETRAEPLPECWLKMTNSQKSTYRKKKKEEYFSLNKDKLIKDNVTRY